MKTRLGRRARRRRHSTEAAMREVFRNAVRDDSPSRSPLGSCVQARFAGIGLDDDLPELRGEPPQSATFET